MIKQAIQKAIEGGFMIGDKVVKDPKYGWIISWSVAKDKESGGIGHGMTLLHESDFFLDPLFWQALGKSLGWKGEHFYMTFEKQDDDDIDNPEKEETKHFEPLWLYHWHRFIDHLASGKSADSFFEELLK